MAFKILSQNEIDILSEHDKKSYEQAYKEYLERKAFVEKLEQLENIQMSAVSVNKKRIKRIKTPTLINIKLQEYTADTVKGVSLLNATKKVKSTLESRTQIPTFAKYKATLPYVSITTPDRISVESDAQYEIDNIASVPLAIPSTTQYEDQPYTINIPQYPKFSKPDIRDVSIEKYAVSDLPNVTVAIPDTTVAHIDSSKIVTLDTVPVAKPAIVNAVVSNYEISDCKRIVATAPVIDYVKQESKKVELYSVPVLKPNCFSGEIKVDGIDIQKHVSVTAPEVAVTVSKAEIRPLTSIVIPTTAPQVSIDTATIQKVDTPDVSVPDNIHYVERKCRVERAIVPSVSVPQIDVEAELKTIIAKIR